MAAFARTELDVLGFARQDNEAAVQLFAIRDGKTVGRDVFLLENVGDGPTRRCSPRSSSSTTRAAASIPPRGPRARLARRRAPSWRRSCRASRRRRSHLRRAAARREARADGARDAQRGRDARARAGTLAGRRGQDARRARGAGRRRSACRARRCASSATTSAPSRAANRSAAWSSSRRAGRAPASTAASGSRPCRARTTSPATRRSSGAASAARSERGGDRRGAALGAARPRHHRRRQGPGERRQGVLDELGLHDLPLAGLAKEREELFLPRPRGADRAAARPRRRCTWSSGCATRPTGSRSPTTATLRAKRSVRSALDDLPGVGPDAQARAAAGLRLDQAGPRGARRADRRGAGHQPRPWPREIKATLEA